MCFVFRQRSKRSRRIGNTLPMFGSFNGISFLSSDFLPAWRIRRFFGKRNISENLGGYIKSLLTIAPRMREIKARQVEVEFYVWKSICILLLKEMWKCSRCWVSCLMKKWSNLSEVLRTLRDGAEVHPCVAFPWPRILAKKCFFNHSFLTAKNN